MFFPSFFLSLRVGNTPTKCGCITCYILWMEAALPRSSEQTMWVLLCNTVLLLLAPHGVGNHWETCTHPSTARQSHTPTLTLNGFSAFFPLRHQCDRPRSPPLAPQKGWQINSSATFLDQWTMRQWQRCGLTHWTQRHIVRYPALPALPCHVNWEYMMCLTGAIMWPVVSCSISALLVMCVGGFFA